MSTTPAPSRQVVPSTRWRYHTVVGTRVALLVDVQTDRVVDFIVLNALLAENAEEKLRMAVIGRAHAFVSRLFDRLNDEFRKQSSA